MTLGLNHMSFEMRRGKVTDNLPLGLASPLYKLKQAARMLAPFGPRYPLSDENDQLASQPLLFLSAGRSGTTLLRSMLVAGGDIAIPPQSAVLCWVALRFRANQGRSWRSQCLSTFEILEGSRVFDLWDFDVYSVRHAAFDLPPARRNLACLLDLVYRRYAERHFPAATAWGDQSVENTLQVQWLHAVFPRGRYLHVLRDGRDVAASWTEHGKTAAEAAQMWLIGLEKTAWLRRRVEATGYLEIRYEDLVSDPEATLRRVCDFAGIPYRPTMLDYWRSASTIEHRDGSRLHRNLGTPVFTASVGSWRDRLNPADQRHVMEALGPALARQGFGDGG